MDKDTRIAIIGAGPAGLSAGMYLEQAGFSNYVIYERADQVGGKCLSPTYNGRRYEMGAFIGAPSYYAIQDVEEFCGITHDGPKQIRGYKNKNGVKIDPFKSKNFIQASRLHKLHKQVKEMGKLLDTKYAGYDLNGHRGVAKGCFDGYSATPERRHIMGVNENLKDLALPFRVFCERNGLDLIEKIWIGPFTAFGYGFLDEIPAAYVLKHLDYQTITDFTDENLWTWKDGTQSIWESLNGKLKNPAVLSSNISQVERHDGKVYITVDGTVEIFDKLIVTSPLQYFGEYADIRDDEARHFRKIDYERYDTMAFLTVPYYAPETTYYVLENMSPSRVGHLMMCYRRWPDINDQPYIAHSLRKLRDGDELDREKTKAWVLNDLRLMESPSRKIVDERTWYYFPHIYTEDYSEGWYDDVEAMQGKYDTYYAGEIMSFGNMNETAEYSRELVERFFKD